ncbi:MarR family transcriptional regulator [Leucobacter insecticola]|uniref:MarR family transcriptional regulator n=1 Tax=Leucobacter insecticola TaxID=2714934 RepID=A0A6G8FK25_9MICO|nr:MarR family transcriptional regulator [Leucobacter insecticola]QIM16820.1 MarR family transcriptional regulator [Leucobacter insecticola]
MGTRDADYTPLELEMWDLRDRATETIPRMIPGVDEHAMRLCMTLRTASNLVFLDLHEDLQKHGDLTPAELNVLLIANLQGEVEFRHLTKFASLKKATASTIVDSLVKRGLLSRRISPEDRRVMLIAPTELGASAFQRDFARYNEREKAWSALITDEERETLVRILSALISRGLGDPSLLEETDPQG